jgi:hypothetical protein
MIRTLRAFFLSRLLREKLLLLAFVAIGMFWWLSSFTTRANGFWRTQRSTTIDLADQKQWLERGPTIENEAKQAASRLDPAKTRDRTRLFAEVSNLANEAGLRNTSISPITPSVTAGQFSVHSVNFSATNVDWDPLIKKFYPVLQAKAPYIGIEQFTLQVPNPANRMHVLTMRISSVEVSQ